MHEKTKKNTTKNVYTHNKRAISFFDTNMFSYSIIITSAYTPQNSFLGISFNLIPTSICYLSQYTYYLKWLISFQKLIILNFL